MKKYIILSKSKSDNIRYVFNTDPLLWTDDKNKAKIFTSESEILTDLYNHMGSLDKMNKELGLTFEMEVIS